jgi:hypothetical protein
MGVLKGEKAPVHAAFLGDLPSKRIQEAVDAFY